MPRSNNQHTLEESQDMNRRKVLRSPAAENLAQRGVMGHFLTLLFWKNFSPATLINLRGLEEPCLRKLVRRLIKTNKYIRAAESSLQAP